MNVADEPGRGGPGGDAQLADGGRQIPFGSPGLGGKAGDATAYAGDGGAPNCDGGNTSISLGQSGAMGNGKKNPMAVHRADVTVGGGNAFGALKAPPGYPLPGLPGGHGGSVSIIGGTPRDGMAANAHAFVHILRIADAGNGGPGGDGCSLNPNNGGGGGAGGDLNTYFDHIIVDWESNSSVHGSFNGNNGGDGGGFGRGGRADSGPKSWLTVPVSASFNPGQDGNRCPLAGTTGTTPGTTGTFTLTVTTSGTGTGTVQGDPQSGIQCPSPNPAKDTCQTTVPAGTVVSLVPTANPGSVFDGWTGACPPLTTVNCQVRVTQNLNVNAIFNLTTTPPPRTAQGTLTNGSGSALAYSVQTNQAGNAFELILPAGDQVTTFATPAGFSANNCLASGNVEICTNGTVQANTPLTGMFDHTGTIAAGDVQVAFSTDNGVTFSPTPPATLTGPATPSTPAPVYQCVGSPFALFDNFNSGAVANGGTQPSFDTAGNAYCLISISTYHYNGGAGVPAAGTVGLLSETAQQQVGPLQAVGSSASGAPNGNWVATVSSAGAPVVIDGAYACADSDPLTWSQNAGSGGQGFCRVMVEVAQQVG